MGLSAWAGVRWCRHVGCGVGLLMLFSKRKKLVRVEFPRDGRHRFDPVKGCWLWLGGLTAAGYRHHHLHREAYEAAFGPIPPGWHCHHKCEVRRCQNPYHLEALPQLEHSHQHWAHDTQEVREWGPRNPDVTLAEIAEHFGISQMSVQNILYGRRWIGEVDDEDPRPVRYCAWSKCGKLVEGGRRHKKACCRNHRSYAWLERAKAEGRYAA